MTPLAAASEFEPAFDDLQDHLPDWWRTRDPNSQLYLFLEPIASQIDTVSALWQQPADDQALTTAGPQGLYRNFQFAWGLQSEQTPAVQSQLVAIIQALVADNGSINALTNILTALVQDPQGGPVLTFLSGGGGLTFPADGSGLIMYEFAPGDLPKLVLAFPADGSGRTFPADGSGLIFGDFAYLEILAEPSHYQLTVRVLTWLVFDRPAFARLVDRCNPADWLPPVILEVTSLS